MSIISRRDIVIGSAVTAASLSMASSPAEAVILSATDFIDVAKAWMKAKTKSFNDCWATKGGWEGWAQCDLTMAMLAKNHGYEIEREMLNVYNSRDRPDFVVNKNQSGAARIVVEIKCESFENGIDNFIKGVLIDEGKLASNSMTSGYQTATRLVIGFFTNPAPDLKRAGYDIFPEGAVTRNDTKNGGFPDFYMCWKSVKN